jgi:ribonuclease HI
MPQLLQLDIPALQISLAPEPLVPPTTPQTSDLCFYIDGSCTPNPGTMHIGLCLKFKGEVIYEHSENTGTGTNNVAEFCALIQALHALKSLQTKDHEAAKVPCLIHSDSTTIVNAVQKKIRLKGDILNKLLGDAWRLMEELTVPATLIWVPRAANKAAHKLSYANTGPRNSSGIQTTEMHIENPTERMKKLEQRVLAGIA